jgi:flagellar biosynthesis/type III secretory pathway M-ring protein FliF/YscJ
MNIFTLLAKLTESQLHILVEVVKAVVALIIFIIIWKKKKKDKKRIDNHIEKSEKPDSTIEK